MEDKKSISDIAKKVTNKKSGAGSNSSIDVEPTLKEANGNTAVIGWGRMNPITSGHELLVNTIKSVAKKNSGTPMLFLTRSQDAKKNPLSYNDKFRLAKMAFGSIVQTSNVNTIIQAVKSLEDKYDNLILVSGSDRVEEYQTLLNKYNGKEYTFANIQVVSAGNRVDPDSDDANDMNPKNMSASVMRKLASAGDKEGFIKGLPSGLKSSSDEVYELVRSGMKLAEELEIFDMLDEAVLNFAQRRKRALIMRKYKSRIAVARKIMSKKLPSSAKIAVRARKKAITMIRKKVAGKKGANYANLSPSEKMMIDAKVQKRQSAINRIAKRLIPQIRKDAAAKLSKMNSGSKNEEFEAFLEQTGAPVKRFHKMRNEDGSMKTDRRFRAFRHMKKEDVDRAILAIIEEVALQIENDDLKIERSLNEKAEKSGHDIVIIKEVYARGVTSWNVDNNNTPEQHGFARVNSFIAGSDIDADLSEAVSKDQAHKLGVGLNFKHMKNHAIHAIDKDMDSDVDNLENMGKEEITGAEKKDYTAIMKKKYELEKKHTKVGDAFESVQEGVKDDKMLDAALQAIHRRVTSKNGAETIGSSAFDIAKSFNLGMNARDLEKKYREKYPEVKQAIGKVLNKRKFEFTEEGGAGEWGTDKLSKKYKKDTPCQEAVDVRHDRYMRSHGKKAKDSGYSSDWYFTNKDSGEVDFKNEKEFYRVNGRFADAKKSAQDWAKKNGHNSIYVMESFRKTDDINEAFDQLLEDAGCALITRADIKELEKFADELLSKFNIDIEFTKHFGERMSDDRNHPCVTIGELKAFFRKVYANAGAKIKGSAGMEAVLRDIQKDLNMPVVIDRVGGGEVEVRFKTIMRKKNFMSPDRKITY